MAVEPEPEGVPLGVPDGEEEEPEDEELLGRSLGSIDGPVTLGEGLPAVALLVGGRRGGGAVVRGETRPGATEALVGCGHVHLSFSSMPTAHELGRVRKLVDMKTLR